MIKRNIRICLVLSITLINSYYLFGAEKWKIYCTKDYCYSLPDDWRKLNRMVKPRIFGDTILNREYRFSPEEIVNSGILGIYMYKSSTGKKLDVLKKWQNDSINIFLKDNISSRELYSNGKMNGLVIKGVSHVKDKDSYLTYYMIMWYLQGEKNIYIIKYGSYSSMIFYKYMKTIDKMILTFHENK